MSLLSKGLAPRILPERVTARKKHMSATTHEDKSIYEIGYLIVSSIPEEKVPEEAESIKKIITDAGSSVITEEAPHRQELAYTMRRKTVSGGYEKYDAAYFGWVKFEVAAGEIEAIKKAIEIHPSILRTLVVTTVREATYLGKRASAMITASGIASAPGVGAMDKKDAAAPATIEEMDKSIDNMVKEV